MTAVVHEPGEMTAREPVAAAPAERQEPTVWGLSIVELHDRFWASRGVQVVRMGERSTIVDDAELFLLTDPRMLVTLRISRVVEKMVWMKPHDSAMVTVASTSCAGVRAKVWAVRWPVT